MKLNKALLSIIVVIIILLSGCWDNKELDELLLPLVSSIDIAEADEKEYPDDKYVVSASYPVFYEKTEKAYSVTSTAGYLISETSGRMSARVGEVMITGQLQVLLLGEKLAEEGNINDVIDLLTRNPDVKAAINMAVVNGRAKDILNKEVRQYPNAGEYLRILLKNSKESNFYPYITLFHYNREVYANFTAPLIPYIIYKDNDIVLAGSCYVNNGKRIAHLGREETETAVMLRGITSKGTISFPLKENEKIIDNLSVICSNKRSVRIKKDGEKYIIDITIKLTGNVVEHTEQSALKDGKDKLKLGEATLEKIIKEKAEAMIRKTQEEWKCDTLGIANIIKANSREKLMKEDIDEIIQNAQINVDVKVSFKSTGGKM